MGLSGPRMLLILYIPMMLLEFICVIPKLVSKQRIKFDILYNGFVLVLANFVGFVVFKKIIARYIGHVDISVFKIAPLGNVIKNIFDNIVTLFISFNLFTTLRCELFPIIDFLFKGSIFIIFIIMLVYIFKFEKSKEKHYVVAFFLISILGVFSYLSLTGITTTERYYFISTYLLIITIILGIEKLFTKNKIFSNCFVVWLIIYIQVNLIINFIPMNSVQGNITQKHVTNYLVENGYTEVYASYWNSGILKGLSNGALNTGHFWNSFEPFIWLTDKELYVDKTTEKEVAIILTDKEEKEFKERNDMDTYILNNMKKTKEIDEYNIYKVKNNPVVKANLPKKKGDVSIYNFSKRYAIKNALEININNNYIITNRNGGVSAWGPYINTSKGTYDLILNYEILESNDNLAGYFDVALNGGAIVKVSKNIEKTSTSLEVNNIIFDNDTDVLEFRVFTNEGTVLKLKNIKILRK
jgi:hypothetical protein